MSNSVVANANNSRRWLERYLEWVADLRIRERIAVEI